MDSPISDHSSHVSSEDLPFRVNAGPPSTVSRDLLVEEDGSDIELSYGGLAPTDEANSLSAAAMATESESSISHDAVNDTAVSCKTPARALPEKNARTGRLYKAAGSKYDSPAALSSTPSRHLLRSSSSSSVSRKIEGNESRIAHPSAPPASKDTPAMKRRHSIGGSAGAADISALSVRRSSLARALPLTNPSFSSRSVTSAASELQKLAPTPAKSASFKGSSFGRTSSNVSLQSPRPVSKLVLADGTKFSNTSTLKSPITSSRPSPKPATYSPRSSTGSALASPTTYKSSSSTTSAHKASPSNGTTSATRQKFSPVGSAGTKRTPSITGNFGSSSKFHGTSISDRPAGSGNSFAKRPSSPMSVDKFNNGRRKSLTPDNRDPRSVSSTSVEGKAGDDVRLDLRGQRLRSLDCNLVNLTPKLEFVYLRDNKLSSFTGIEILRRVKVLDLSFNEFKGGSFEPLGNCKALQQLYLAGNQIISLSGLPQLPNLEFLSIAQNKLKSLAMATQPRLQVLAASKNKISTLEGFPHLPSLEHLRLEENPISDMAHVEAASILLVGPTLKKFNDRDLPKEEQELAHCYPAHTALCIRDGWDFCSVDDATESTMQFLVAQWNGTMPPGYMVKKAAVDPPFEGDPCHCHFSIVKEFPTGKESVLMLKYQWFIGDKTPTNFIPIDGAVDEVYWPKHEDVGCCLKVECTPVLGEAEFSSIFAVSFPVAPGTGCPKILNMRVEGQFVEGNVIQGKADIAWCGGTPGKGIVSWLRRYENSVPVAISGAEEHEYRLTLDDVGAQLLVMYTPVTEEGVNGEAYFATTPIIQAGAPYVCNVHIVGDPVEGRIIKGVGKYFGGREGTSKFEWLREDPDSGEFKLVSRGTTDYLLTNEDVGLRMMFIYTPVNADGYQGDPVSAITAKSLLAPPKVTQIRIVGDIREGNKVAVNATVSGGLEGASRVQWFKTLKPDASLGDANLEAISTSKIAKAFRIPLGAVGYYLAAKYIPVRSDGESGDPAIVFSETPVEMLPPGLNFLSITGEFLEGEILTASYGYIGGHEGGNQYSWYLHEKESDPGVLVSEAVGLLQYQISKEAVNKLVSFRCIPVRDDGMVGEGRTAIGQDRVRPGSPKLLSLQISGVLIEGAELQVDKKYWGGDEGPSKLQWFLTRSDGAQREIKGATSLTYTVRSEDIDGLLCVSCEPMRIDGAKGSVSFSQLVGPVLPAPPSCESLELCGEPVEGGCLSFRVAYKGGEKGACTHEWLRRRVNGKIDRLGNNEILELTSDDVGCCIELIFTPVRKDGFVGIPQRVVSDTVIDAQPVGINLVVPSCCCEGLEIIPQKSYFGGCEGVGRYTWFSVQSKLEVSEIPVDAMVLSDSMTYTPSLEDVGSYIALQWVPTRKDGRKGKPLVACSEHPVESALPTVRKLLVKQTSPELLIGEGHYYGGLEGKSEFRWYRETSDGLVSLISGATAKNYTVREEDYTCSLIFGYIPVREDGIAGKLVLSEPSATILPELPWVEKLVLTGKSVEGEILTALEVLPKDDSQLQVWDKYKKDVKYQWSRSSGPGIDDSFQQLPLQRACSYKVRSEDIGFCMRCECIVTDIFGRSAEPVCVATSPIAPGTPKMDKLEIEGRGYHTNLYAVRGIYSGGKEGKSKIQWFRAMAGSPDLIPIPGEDGRMYEANVDDVGYRLVAVYTPIREDGVEGVPVSASTEPIAVELDVAKEVKQKLELGAMKFEALRDRERLPFTQQGLGSLERRILEVNKKRIKVVKPGSKTSFPNTEIRGTYAPPFHVEVFRNDQHRLKIVIDSENEVDLMVQTRYIRDVIVLFIRGLAQRYNSTPLNLLLKM